MGEKTPGRWGRFGGRYVAEALWQPLEEIARVFDEARLDEDFIARTDRWLDHRAGRPTPLSRMARLSGDVGGAMLWFKREDLCQGGSFCINAAILQALLAERMGRRGLITETASGDFGVALGSIGKALGLEVRVYMGREDLQSESLAVAQMRDLGVELESVDTSARGRRAPRAEAMRHWMANTREYLYCTSLLASPDPYPRMLIHALAVLGAETAVQLERRDCHPSYIIAPIGAGGFASGFFEPFLEEESIQLIGVQAGGEPQGGRHAASMLSGRPGVFHGTLSNVLQDEHGQILTPHSAAAGLCAVGVGPQHASWAARGEVIYASINDAEARTAQRRVADLEGLTISLEAAHAVAYALKLMPKLEPEQHILVGITGDGRRDLVRRAEQEEERR